MRLSLEPHLADKYDRRHSVASSLRRRLETLASVPLEDLQDPVVRTCTLRNWNPRPACGTAFRSVCISISVFGLAPTRTGVCRYLPCFGDVSVRSGQQVA